MNDKYLMSAGVDKVLVVWDVETKEKIARFGQQPNISAGLHLVHDKLISITIDGVARAYDVGKGEMIRQFKISDLSKQVDSDTEERKAVQDIGAGSGGSGMVQWASGSGSTVTVSPKCPKSPNTKLTFQCATKILMVTIRWDGYIGQRHPFGGSRSKEVFTVNIGDSPYPTISHDPNTITDRTSAATHSVNESIIHTRKSINGKPCLHPKHPN
jgi:hypothetical protein